MMKRTFFIYLLFVICYGYSMDNPQQSKLTISITANPAVAQISIEDLRAVRSKSAEEKEKLLKQVKEYFPLEATIKNINAKQNPQIILWFSNYFGSVMEKTLNWYKDNVFSKIPKGNFWLTDLKAWACLSVDKNQLRQTYGPLVAKIDKIQEAKVSNAPFRALQLLPSECPLTTKSSDVLDEELNKTERYRLLSSKKFFQWLLEQKNDALINSALCNALCKDYPREDSLRCSLTDLGYQPELFKKTIEKLKDKPAMFDVDFSLVYPVLQYLEGIYYASTIIEQTDSQEIVFMLPNKEFTYYMVPGEKEYFGNFVQGVRDTLNKSSAKIKGRKVNISFEPFAYGQDFYDAPYKFSGNRLKKNSLLEKLPK